MPSSCISSHRASAVALACAATLTLAGGALIAPAAALAKKGGHVKVTVEVLGKAPAYKMLIKRTVTLSAKPVVKDGGSCTGESAAGALQLATKGAWAGTWSKEYSDYEVTKIKGVYLPFESKAAANWYWNITVDGKEASAGICALKPKSGQTIVFKPACYGKACPKAKKANSSALAADRKRG